ncbi:MAG: hypothetical protein HYZ58_15385 [Acidobacteria bacterium]|nr:hypothetical protein [Acidobacteriota bacterium]
MFANRTLRNARAPLIVAGLIWPLACTERPDPIQVQRRALVVENQTSTAWGNVEVWINDHYRVTRSRMERGERFAIPLDTFVAGFGQRFDPSRQRLTGVEITATGEDGRPVKLVWGTGRRK